jgi:hypothetical protein
MATVHGGIGSESIETLLKDLRCRFSGQDNLYLNWESDPKSYTIQAIANYLRAFLFEEKSIALGASTWNKLRICGYSAGRPLAEVWEVNLMGEECPAPVCVQGEQAFGLRWGR